MNPSIALEALKAEALLAGSFILTTVQKTAYDVRYTSHGDAVSYPDLYSRLAREVDELPMLVLDLSIPPGAESQYSIHLTEAMESVSDDCERVVRKIIKFKSRVKDAASRLKGLHGEFTAWYVLAGTEALKALALHISSVQVKELADSEFLRLTEGIEVTLESMLNAIVTLEAEIKVHRQAQQEKYAMGKDQINASWTTHMPIFNNSSDIAKDNPGRLLKEGTVTELEDWAGEVPAFVSQQDSSPPQAEIKGTFRKTGDARPVLPVLEEEDGDN